MLNPHRKIIDYILNGRNEITKGEADVLVSDSDLVISEMISLGILSVVRDGVYKLKGESVNKIKNQLNLFG